MSYLDEEDGTSRLGVKIAGWVAGLLGFLAVGFWGWGTFPGSSRAWTPDRVAQELETNVGTRELYTAMKAHYPEDYRALVQRLSEASQGTDRQAVEREAYAFSRRFMSERFDDLARAPSAQLHDIAREYARLVHVLQQSDVRLCAQFVTNGFTPGARPGPDATAIVNRIGALQVAAARAGESQPGDSRGALTEPQAMEFGRALQARSASAANLLSDERALRTAAPADQCAAGVAIYDTVGALPADLAATLIIEILRESFGGQPRPAS